MNKPRALDLFCCAGGATRGLQLAGFHVTGVDIVRHKNYCGDAFIQADALTVDLSGYDFIWASPPCQRYSNAQRLQKNEHPDLVGPIRERLRATGTPWSIENVPGAPLINPVLLCGCMFGLQTYRHRLVESSFYVRPPNHPAHEIPTTKMGRAPKDGEFIHVVGNFSGVQKAREAMQIDWMNRDELREAIPPAYSEFIGKAALQYIEQWRAA